MAVIRFNLAHQMCPAQQKKIEENIKKINCCLCGFIFVREKCSLNMLDLMDPYFNNVSMSGRVIIESQSIRETWDATTILRLNNTIGVTIGE